MAVDLAGLSVAEELAAFVRDAAVPGAGVEEDALWAGLAALVADLGPRRAELLARRGRPDAPTDCREDARTVSALADETVDPEIAQLVGTQLVVAAGDEAGLAEAVGARWGSLYAALYDSAAIDERDGRARGESDNPLRWEAVVAVAAAFLDATVPLVDASHADALAYVVEDGELLVRATTGTARLAVPAQFVGYRGDPLAPGVVVLGHGGLHIALVLDRAGRIGAGRHSGVDDVRVESAVTVLVDLAAGGGAAGEKVAAYSAWHALMTGDFGESPETDGAAAAQVYLGPDGAPLELSARPLLLMRHADLAATTDAVRGPDGTPVPELFLDAVLGCLAAVPDLRGPVAGGNSRTGSVYVVLPDLDGPDEVAFAVDVFARVEEVLRLAVDTVKIGLLGAGRRTAEALPECLERAASRLVLVDADLRVGAGDVVAVTVPEGILLRAHALSPDPWAPGPDGLPGVTAWVASATAATLHTLRAHHLAVPGLTLGVPTTPA